MGRFKISLYLYVESPLQQEGSSAQCVFFSMCSTVNCGVYSNLSTQSDIFSLFLTPNPTQKASAVVWQLRMQKAKNVFIHMQQ